MSDFFTGMLKWGWITLLEFTKDSQSPGARKSRSLPARQVGDSQRSASGTALSDRVERSKGGCYTWEEIARHDSPTDCWVVVKNKVYDVTEFGKVHPGGKVIFTQGGRDATEAFATFHAGSTWSLLKQFYVGDLKRRDGEQESGIVRDFHELRATFAKQGLFESSKAYYAWKFFSNLAILACAVCLLLLSDGWGAMFASAFLMGLFWQQCGWLAHDFLHHQVFKDRSLNNLAGYVIGPLLQGFSVDWWKSKHNTHHAVPNELDGDKYAVDPDIDTLPLLAWSTEMLESISDSSQRAMIRFQHYFFFPVLMLARMSWAQQSFLHACRVAGEKGTTEVFLLGLHYTWYLGLAFFALPTMKAVVYVVLSQCLCGILLSFAFVQSHNGMEVYSDAKDFVTAQIVSTRDIAHNVWVHWFMGGLNYQIEHHLFPSMPRHNLGKARPAVQALCAKHSLVYEECDMLTSTARVMQRLIDVASHA